MISHCHAGASVGEPINRVVDLELRLVSHEAGLARVWAGTRNKTGKKLWELAEQSITVRRLSARIADQQMRKTKTRGESRLDVGPSRRSHLA